MSVAHWLTLLGACLLISLTPGAGAVNVMTNTMNLGLRKASWGIIGQQVALVAHIVIVAAGLGVIVASSPLLFRLITYAGAAYLIFLGIRQLLSRPGQATDDGQVVWASESGWSVLSRGFWVNFTNPKAIVFFLAFLPQFISADRALIPQYLLVVVTVVAVDIAVMGMVFGLGARSFRRFVRSARGQRRMAVTFGSLFIALGLSLLFL